MADKKDWGADGCDCDKCLCEGDKDKASRCAAYAVCEVCGKMCDAGDLIVEVWDIVYCKICQKELGSPVKAFRMYGFDFARFEKSTDLIMLKGPRHSSE